MSLRAVRAAWPSLTIWPRRDAPHPIQGGWKSCWTDDPQPWADILVRVSMARDEAPDDVARLTHSRGDCGPGAQS